MNSYQPTIPIANTGTTINDQTPQKSKKMILLAEFKNCRKWPRITLLFTMLIILALATFLWIKTKNQVYVKPADVRIKPTSTQFPILTNISPVEKAGQVIFIENNNLVSLDENKKGKETLFSGRNLKDYIALTPDKTIILFIDGGQIWSYSLLTKEAKQLIDVDKEIRFFELSPNGQFLVFEKVETYVACCGQKEATKPVTMPWVMSLDGKMIRKIPWPPDDSGSHYEYSVFEKWFPDNRYLFLRGTGALDTDNNFWEYAVETNKIYRFIRYGDKYDTWNMPLVYFSPNGRRMAYTKENNLWISDIDGKNVQRALSAKSLITTLSWGPDGKEIIAADDVNTYVISEEPGRDNALIPLPATNYNLTWAPNKRWVASSEFFGKDLKISVYDFLIRQVQVFPVGKVSPEKEIYLESLKITPSGNLYYLYRSSGSVSDATNYRLWKISLLNSNHEEIAEGKILSLPVWRK